MLARALCGVLGLLLWVQPAGADDPFLRRTAAVQVVESVGPSVVNITTERLVQAQNPFFAFRSDPFFDRFFRDFFEPSERSAQSLGSGVIIDTQGHVLTNDHVVSRATRIQVTMADGREFEAELIGADPNNDIAVLRLVTDEALPWVAPGGSEDLMVGEPVIAIGNPFGLSNTVTTGVISALNRSLRTEDRVFHGFLQTDASINPGNSGGPLLNAEGELVGINTAVYNGGQGIGFAIPIDVAKRIVDELIAHGEVSPVWVGLELQDLSPELRATLALPRGLDGAVVTRVRDESPALGAGVRRGDVVTRVEGRPVSGARGFFELLQSVTAGQRISLQIRRGKEAREIPVRAESVPDGLVEELALEKLGVELRPAQPTGYAVRSVRPGGGAARIGVQPGDLLLGINGLALDGAESFRRSVLDLRGRTRALVVVQRGAGRYHVTIPLV
jgi:serine protease Do